MFAFVFSRKTLNRYIVFFVVAWAVCFVLRVTFYVLMGPEPYFLSSGNRILSVVSGVFAGIAMCLMVVKRKATRVPKVPGGATTSHAKE